MQHNKDDFFKNDKKKLTATGPEQGERQGRQLCAERGEGIFGLRRVWGSWQGDVGRQPGQESQAAGQQIRSLAPTGACRSGLSKAWKAF